jgi:MAF protein
VRVAVADVAETDHLLDDPLVGALNVALAKARATELEPDEVVLAADTLVVDGAGCVLGKPATADDARTMLANLRGGRHTVVTGVALRSHDGCEWGAAVAARVVMRAYADAEIEAYIERKQPFDKAGAYAIQDAMFRPVARVEGCYLNVVGLPLCAVARGLETLGVRVPPGDFRPPCRYCEAGSQLVAISS